MGHERGADSSDSALTCRNMQRSHIAYTNDSCRRYKRVTSRIEMDHEPGADSRDSAAPPTTTAIADPEK